MDEKLRKNSKLRWNDQLMRQTNKLENADMDRAKIFMRMPRETGHTISRSHSYSMVGTCRCSDIWVIQKELHGIFPRTVKDNTFSRDYTFDVEKTAKSVVMSVNG